MSWLQWAIPTRYVRLREVDESILEKCSPKDIAPTKATFPLVRSLIMILFGAVGFLAGFLVSRHYQVSSFQQIPGTVPQGESFPHGILITKLS
jgi:hypothetical protein